MERNIHQGPFSPLLLSARREVFLSKYHLRPFNWSLVSSTNLRFNDDPLNLNVPSWNSDDNHIPIAQNDGANLSAFVTSNDPPGDTVPDMILGVPKGASHLFIYFIFVVV